MVRPPVRRALLPVYELRADTETGVDSNTGERRFRLNVKNETLSRAPVVTDESIVTAGDTVRAWRVP